MEKRNELELIDTMVLDNVGEQLMAGAYCGTDCLAWLVPCPVLDDDVLAGSRPGMSLEASGGENALVAEHQMRSRL